MPQPLAPTGLLTDLLHRADGGVGIQPSFAWLLPAAATAVQCAWRIEVGRGDAGLWDSGRQQGGASTAVSYQGPPLPADVDLWWRVQVWCGGESASPWSERAGFRVRPGIVFPPELPRLECEAALTLERLDDDTWLADFGRSAFAAPLLRLPGPAVLTLHAGERRHRGRVDREPPGCIRHRALTVNLAEGTVDVRVAVPPDRRNTRPPAVLVPEGRPEVLPFRWLELTPLPAEPAAGAIRREVLRVPLDRTAAAFHCDDPRLETVWRLCADTVDATTFLGLFVDGDRERIAYEGDAWINQLAHRALDRTPATSRATIDHLLRHPTWPTEWQLHLPLMAWEDWLYTGDRRGLERWRDDLAVRTLAELDRGDGLISTVGTVTPELLARLRLDRLQDLVDWPPGSFTAGGTGERDDHEMPAVNTVVNAFHAAACAAMADIDAALGRDVDAAGWRQRSARTTRALDACWLEEAGAYADGPGSMHAAIHSTLFPLAFGLVPEARRAAAVSHIIGRGMACSVYGAQHLLDALYRHGRADAGLDLMTAAHDRGWLRMLEVGSTMTTEAWDHRYKNNLDWNHAWAAAPLNVCARWILGVQPTAPGCAQVGIHPQPGRLRRIAGRVPTMRGRVDLDLVQEPGRRCTVQVMVPGNVLAEVSLPWTGRVAQLCTADGTRSVTSAGGRIAVGSLGPGVHHLLLTAEASSR